MITNFNIHNLIVEKTGINLEIKSLSEQIFNLIKNNKKKIYNFDGNLFDVNIMRINKIIVTINDSNSSFDISRSEMTEKGFNININLNKNEIEIKVIHHELEHALKSYMIGKDKDIEKSHQLKSHTLSQNFIKNPEIKKFIELYYNTQEQEIDSFVSEAYYEIINKFKILNQQLKSEITEEQFNTIFYIYLKNDYISIVSELLKNYNFKELKKFNSNELVIFFNVLNDNTEQLKVSRKSNNLKKLFIAIKAPFNNIYFRDHYYKSIDKSVKIENLDKILKTYQNKFLKASDKISIKLAKLYDIILDDLKKEKIIV